MHSDVSELATALTGVVKQMRGEVERIREEAGERYERIFGAWQHLEDEMASLTAQMDLTAQAADDFASLYRQQAGPVGTA